MHELLRSLSERITFYFDLKEDLRLFLEAHQCAETVTHSVLVGQKVRRLASCSGVNPDAAEVEGWLILMIMVRGFVIK